MQERKKLQEKNNKKNRTMVYKRMYVTKFFHILTHLNNCKERDHGYTSK